MIDLKNLFNLSSVPSSKKKDNDLLNFLSEITTIELYNSIVKNNYVFNSEEYDNKTKEKLFLHSIKAGDLKMLNKLIPNIDITFNKNRPLLLSIDLKKNDITDTFIEIYKENYIEKLNQVLNFLNLKINKNKGNVENYKLGVEKISDVLLKFKLDNELKENIDNSSPKNKRKI